MENKSKGIGERMIEAARWTIQRFANDEDAKNNLEYSKEECQKLFGKDEQISVINQEFLPGMGNALVNAGINQLTTLLAGGGGVNFGAGAYLGVGTSTAAENASYTDLQAASDKLRVAMNGAYPTYGTSQKITWQSDFTSAQANFSWQEFAVFSGASGGTMLNRKISDQGTKTSGQTWRLTLEITFS